MHFQIHPEVSAALKTNLPVVALESTVIAHGLPYPQNLQTAKQMEKIVRENGAVPATVAVFDGNFHVGLNESQLEILATGKEIRKISRRDLPIAVAKKLTCATTVATTMFIANRANIKVFATGGIGGVHRGFAADISADLNELANTPMITVCAGAKIVLDLAATREWLETFGITVLGYKCYEMPAFYSRQSGLAVDERVDSVKEIIEIYESRNSLGLNNAILVTVPVPKTFEISRTKLEEILSDSLAIAEGEEISGKEITPFLLTQMSKRSKGKTLETNIALLKNNAQVASQIAIALNKI